jgi:NagD protein
MDGTIYSGEKLFDGVKELFTFFIEKKIKFYFLTNNSSNTGQKYLEKLNRLGITHVRSEQIITSGDITIAYLKKLRYNTVCLVGTKELENQFLSAGFRLINEKFQEVDCVVSGFDTSFDYSKGDTASFYIRKGAPFYATNEDLVCPVENNEFIPDCGAITAFLEKASGREATFLGKPRKETFDYLLDYIGTNKNNLAIVGDRLYTDIATGFYNDFTSIAVLTGELKLSDLENSNIIPTIILKDINELYQILSNS